ncbi:hypothetical protein F5Y15DRAFT_129179 [Xylariaceae sp. FL0016]|nr:hypothetical protein F5Y15DRAFT_129179 [Xylariaceae sp. FL0016]
MAAFIDWNGLLTSGARKDPPQPPMPNVVNTVPEIHHDGQPLMGEIDTPAAAPVSSPTTIWDSDLLPHLLGAAIVLLATILIWSYLGGRRRSRRNAEASKQSAASYADAVNAVQTDCNQRIAAMEKGFEDALQQRTDSLEERFQSSLAEHTDAIETNVRKSLNKRVETLEVRMKMDQEALEDVHRALSQRMEAFEDYIRSIDGKQLDQEANSIAQRELGQRILAAEETLQIVDGKARASVQRLEAMDDSVRVIDSRSKALSQRVEVVEDNQNTVDGQVTLLSHDVNRGGNVVEKLQRQMKMLPDPEKFKGLTRTWDAKFKKLEEKLEEYHKALEEQLAAPELTWSHIETQEIEPRGPLYTRGFSFSCDSGMISPPSSEHSPSYARGWHSRTYSNASSSGPHTPITPDKRRIDQVGFHNTTFASRQKRLQSRNSFYR